MVTTLLMFSHYTPTKQKEEGDNSNVTIALFVALHGNKEKKATTMSQENRKKKVTTMLLSLPYLLCYTKTKIRRQ